MTQCACHCPNNCEACKGYAKHRFGYELWQKENELVNQRLSWLGFTQSLLFTILLVSEQFELGIGLGISVFGLMTSFVILVGILAAVSAQFKIATGTNDYKYAGISKSKDNKDRAWSFHFGWFPGLGLPLLFVMGWAVICWQVFPDGHLAISKSMPTFEIIIGDFEMRLNR